MALTTDFLQQHQSLKRAMYEAHPECSLSSQNLIAAFNDSNKRRRLVIDCIQNFSPPADASIHDHFEEPLKQQQQQQQQQELPLKKEKKHVTFAPMANQIVYPSPTPEDEYNAWYSDQDYFTFTCECQLTLAIVRREYTNVSSDPNQVTIMGLEGMLSPEQVLLRRQNSLRLMRAILEHQALHKRMGIHDPLSLRCLSEIFSAQSKTRALYKAIFYME